MALTGKTGADAIFRALKRICIVLSHYSAKLQLLISATEAASVITPSQAAAVRGFLTAANDLCAAFDLMASYSGFNTNP
jgi:3-oxoacyl-[acyl-carrier-protein] synthase III